MIRHPLRDVGDFESVGQRSESRGGKRLKTLVVDFACDRPSWRSFSECLVSATSCVDIHSQLELQFANPLPSRTLVHNYLSVIFR